MSRASTYEMKRHLDEGEIPEHLACLQITQAFSNFSDVSSLEMTNKIIVISKETGRITARFFLLFIPCIVTVIHIG